MFRRLFKRKKPESAESQIHELAGIYTMMFDGDVSDTILSRMDELLSALSPEQAETAKEIALTNASMMDSLLF